MFAVFTLCSALLLASQASSLCLRNNAADCSQGCPTDYTCLVYPAVEEGRCDPRQQEASNDAPASCPPEEAAPEEEAHKEEAPKEEAHKEAAPKEEAHKAKNAGPLPCASDVTLCPFCNVACGPQQDADSHLVCPRCGYSA